jgi:hypothetical protein
MSEFEEIKKSYVAKDVDSRCAGPRDRVPKNTETSIVPESRLLRPNSGCGV